MRGVGATRRPSSHRLATTTMDAGLPQYERSPLARSSTSSASRGVRPPTEHLYHRFTSSKGQPWLTLKVASKAPASSYLPAFYQGEAISGSVALCLDREETIKSVSVQVSKKCYCTNFYFHLLTSICTSVDSFLGK